MKSENSIGERDSINKIHFPKLPNNEEMGKTISSQFRQLKRELLIDASASEFVFSSFTHGEGTTSTIINLLASLSLDKDWNICLVDCQGGANNCMNQLAVTYEQGLGDYLESSTIEIEKIIKKTNFNNIRLLPYGFPKRHRYELLTSRKMFSLFSKLTEMMPNTVFIYDAPPIETPEGKFLVNKINKTVLVLEQGKVPMSKVKHLLNTINKENVHGILLNKASQFSFIE